MATGPLFFGFVLVEFYVFVALLVLAILGLAGWAAEREKRERLQTATKDLERIYALTAQALQEHSVQKVDQVNSMIESWDQTYSEEVGEPIPKLSPTVAP